jgi:AraC family ethanolamine operon transcriptional activator
MIIFQDKRVVGEVAYCIVWTTMGHHGNNTDPHIPAQGSAEHCEIIVDSTEHLNELNRLEGWESDYRQLDGGSFRGCFHVRQYTDFLAAKETYSTRVEVECAPPPGMVALFVTTPGKGSAKANGQSLGDHGVQVVWPGGSSRFLFFRPDGGHVVHFDASTFVETYRSLFPGGNRLPERGAQVYRCPPAAVRKLRNFMDQLVFCPAGRFSCAERADGLKRLILETIVAADGGSHSGARTAPVTRRHVAVRARDYIEAHFDEPVTMAMLCRHSAVSARTLERAFIEHFDMSPSHYLKVRRLNAVHGELMRTHIGEHTVTELAMRHGFNHLGRFSHDYKKLFHEMPKDTLRCRPFSVPL